MYRVQRSLRTQHGFAAIALIVLAALAPSTSWASFEKTVAKDWKDIFSVGPRPDFTPSAVETTIKHRVFYSDIEGSTSGWNVVNWRQGQPKGWNIVSGAHSCVGNAWWCGATGFANGDGYDNNWVQILKTNVPINLAGTSGNTLTFKHRMQSEYAYDWGWVMIRDGNPASAWDTLGSYSGNFGSSCQNVSINIPNSWTTRPQPVQLQFLFGSDLTVSTADSADAFTGWSIDDVKITASGNNVRFFDDMESGPSQWTAFSANPGAWWHVEGGPETTPTADCFFLFTNVWVPFQGAISGVVPDFTDAMLTTPHMDLEGVFRGGVSTLRLQFDQWVDLPTENGMYWSLWIQGSNDLVSWTPWRNALNPLVFSGGTPQCQENAFINFDPYNTNRTGVQPGTKYIRLGFRLRDEKQVSQEGAVLRQGFLTEGIYFDNIGVYYVYTITGVEPVNGVPRHERAALSKIFPNPFNPSTTIEFSVPSSGPALVQIHDVQGKAVATVVRESLAAGVYRVRWDGRSDEGRELSSGVYFARLESPGGRDSKRLLMIK
ncbi:MAG TPA: T9SS type A sorting domain-containing protein [Candidatus Eisenbacteria bacterium]|nr:T9SS type A sorting domain-containing protein [Candidatus Eisenbacteria bacterium]